MGADRAREGRGGETDDDAKMAQKSFSFARGGQVLFRDHVHMTSTIFPLPSRLQNSSSIYSQTSMVYASFDFIPDLLLCSLVLHPYSLPRAADGYGFPFWQPRPFQGSWKLLPPMAAMALIALLRCVANVLPRCRAPSAPRFTVASLSLTHLICEPPLTGWVKLGRLLRSFGLSG